MLYIIIRLIFLLILFACVILLIIKRRKSGVNVTKKKRSIWIILVNKLIYLVVLSCLVAIILCPIEDLFLRFNTPEDSYYYSHLPNENIIVFESDRSAFIYDAEHYSSLLHTVTKHEDKWGVTDTHYKENTFNTKGLSSFYNVSARLLDGLVVKNTESGETCIVIDGFFIIQSSKVVHDSEGRIYKPMYYTPPGKTEEICIGYYTVYEGDIPDTITFYYNDEKYVLYGK